ncbi:MAG: dipeptide epimerase, partial [Candidatus Marinimicrobia bacterium]|nr:dipeptide epimerase [Candidatus Neomarinimicrobiota bacterium]
DAREYRYLINEMHKFLPGNATIKSAFDMALYDLNARMAQVPLYQFFGGRKRLMETDVTMGISDFSETERKLKKFLKMGFKKIKTKVGLDFQQDFEKISMIRKIGGPEMTIRIDANQGWDRAFALQSLHKLHPLNIEYCEQPVKRRDLTGMKYLNDHSPIPIMADESLFSPEDALDIIHLQAASMMNIKISKSGGFLRAQQIADIAQSAHIPCMVGCMSESGLGNTAFSHFASAHEIVRFYDLDANVGHLNEPLIGGVKFIDGVVHLPEEPGIGCVPDPEYIKNLKSL